MQPPARRVLGHRIPSGPKASLRDSGRAAYRNSLRFTDCGRLNTRRESADSHCSRARRSIQRGEKIDDANVAPHAHAERSKLQCHGSTAIVGRKKTAVSGSTNLTRVLLLPLKSTLDKRPCTTIQTRRRNGRSVGWINSAMDWLRGRQYRATFRYQRLRRNIGREWIVLPLSRIRRNGTSPEAD